MKEVSSRYPLSVNSLKTLRVALAKYVLTTCGPTIVCMTANALVNATLNGIYDFAPCPIISWRQAIQPALQTLGSEAVRMRLWSQHDQGQAGGDRETNSDHLPDPQSAGLSR